MKFAGLKWIRKFNFKILLVSILLSLVATLLWAELVGLSPFVGDLELDQEMLWKLHPSILSGVNKFGYRSRAIDLNAPKQELRILALGDSSTYGLGVLPGQTYAARLEKMLSKEGIKCEIANLGVPGYTLYQGLKLLKNWAYKLKPDFCIFLFGHNDSQYSRTGLADSNRRLIGAPLTDSVLPRISRIARLYQFARSEWGPIKYWQSSPRVPLAEYRELVKQSIEFCRANRIIPVWLEYAELNKLEPRAYNEATKEICQQQGAIFVEMTQLKSAGKKPSLWMASIQANSATK